MDFIQVFFLAIVQGLTEFLPISSSAHLILVPKFFGWGDQGLAFDVAVHVGTLFAVVLYFRQDIKKIVSDLFISLSKKREFGESRLAFAILIGTLPVGLCGLLFNDFIENHLRSAYVIASSTILFALLLWKADMQKTGKSEKAITIKDAVFIGIAQALALIPGTSRSGITMTAALLLGYGRVGSAKFSFLLSIPVIFLAGGLKTFELVISKNSVEWIPILLGVLISATSAYLCICLFLKLIQRSGMLPFVVYRLLLGLFLFTVFS